MHAEQFKDKATDDVECGGGGGPLTLAVLLGVVFVLLLAAALTALSPTSREGRTPDFLWPDVWGAFAGQVPSGLWVALFTALVLLFVTLFLIVLLFCCCGCRKSEGLGAFGLLLAPLVCPVIDGLRVAADALEGAANLMTSVEQMVSLSQMLDGAGTKLQHAAGKVGEFKIPSVNFPGTANLFERATPLPALGNWRPTSRVLEGTLSHNEDALQNQVRDAKAWLEDAGDHLKTAGQRLTDIAGRLHTSASAFRGIADLLARFVPCEKWEKLSEAIKSAPWRIPHRG